MAGVPMEYTLSTDKINTNPQSTPPKLRSRREVDAVHGLLKLGERWIDFSSTPSDSSTAAADTPSETTNGSRTAGAEDAVLESQQLRTAARTPNGSFVYMSIEQE
jgi:hypothetical protein